MNREVKGNLMEWGAIRWLKDKFPKYTWRSTEKWSAQDMKGVDIMGSFSEDGKLVKVQVKSSEWGASQFLSRMRSEIVILIPDDETGGFQIYHGNL